MVLFYFAGTLFVSAFLLFLVQPIIGKLILPKLGGTPQVWNTCMVFFQTALLAGYFYTHAVSTYLRARTQIIVHCVLLFIPLVILFPWGPFNVVEWVPPPGGNPIFATLGLLTVIVGIPFFVVATTAPLLQKWFAHTGHPAARDPYFLYGASNLGSMLALLLYPVLIEPFFGLRSTDDAGHVVFSLASQSWIWTVGYIVLIGLVIGCGVIAYKGAPKLVLAGGPRPHDEPPAPEPSEPTAPPVPAENAVPPAATTPSAADGAGGGTGITAEAPAAAPPPAEAPAPAPKPGPSTAIKKGSKQKQKQKHRHKQQPQPQQKQEPVRRDAIQTAATAAATAAPSKPAAAPVAAPSAPRTDELTPGRRFRWVLLAAVPSSLMLAVTTHMSTDISAIPLFWVLPLSLYLLSFILVFMRSPINWLEQAHTVMLYVQPVLLGMLVVTTAVADVGEVMWPITINLLAFFATALVCHGELAKDRPSTKHLTEFYLWMSVGGMVGGLFNGLIAPVLFPGLWEYPLALFAAGLLRPTLKEGGWLDTLLSGNVSEAPQAHRRGQHRPIRRTEAAPAPGLTRTLDVLLPAGLLLLAFLLQVFLVQGRLTRDELKVRQGIAYGLPLAIACFYYARPLRYGLALGAILLLLTIRENRGGIAQERSYFGILNVRFGEEQYGRGQPIYVYRTLTHGTTQHGANFLKPKEPTGRDDLPNRNTEDLSRLATTYYHRTGPAGMAMERFDWFVKLGEGFIGAGDVGRYWGEKKVERTDDEVKRGNAPFAVRRPLYDSDARLSASLIGVMGTPMLGGMGGPAAQGSALVTAWSEPPYSTIGLGTGTMASYARPFQHLHFYEIDNRIRRYSLPEAGGPRYFHYLHDAGLKNLNPTYGRGAAVHVLMGDARLRMAEPWIPKEWQEKDAKGNLTGQPTKDYRPWKVPMTDRGGPEGFYYLIVVDAFSSDAIPVHLLTKEAVEMYMTRLAPPRVGKDEDGKPRWFPGGVLCVHVSNRHLDLTPVVADIAGSIKFPKIDPTTGKIVMKDKRTEEVGVALKGLEDFEALVVPPIPGKVMMRNKQTGEKGYAGVLKGTEGFEPVLEALAATRGRDNAPGAAGREGLGRPEHIGHTTSEWVMVARDKKDLEYLKPPADYNSLRAELGGGDNRDYWSWREPSPRGRYVWTDDYSNLLAVFHWPWQTRRLE